MGVIFDSGHESSLRINALTQELGDVIRDICPSAKIGLDVGCQDGKLTEAISNKTGIEFYGVEPEIKQVERSSGKVKIIQGFANKLPFSESTFDIVTIISVLEHIPADELLVSYYEIFRVLKPGGYCFGQIPNMNFPIEVHSHLPLQQFLPRMVGDRYLRIFSRGRLRKSEWYRISKNSVRRAAFEVGFKEMTILPYLYPKYVFPKRLYLFYPALKVFPLDYIFWCKKPH